MEHLPLEKESKMREINNNYPQYRRNKFRNQ